MIDDKEVKKIIEDKEDYSGVISFKANKSAKIWSEILYEWVNLTQRSSRLFGRENDCSYWHNEAGNVALLAASAFSAGYVALSETQMEKHGEKKFAGRADLYVADRLYGAYLEAKIGWHHYSSKSRPESTMNNVMDRANNDIKKTQGKERWTGVSASFLGLKFVNKDDLKNNLIGAVKKCEEIAKENDANVFAWCFPSSSRWVGNKTHYYPGIMLAIKDGD